MSQPRIYLFYGTDNRVSLLLLQEWSARFFAKYGDATRFTFDADELESSELAEKVGNVISAQTLFPQPRFIVIKRVAAKDVGKRAFSKPVLAEIERLMPHLDDQTTIVCWEPSGLSPTSPYLAQFTLWEQQGVASCKRAQLPTSGEIAKVVQKMVAREGKSITPEAVRWIAGQYMQREKVVRLEKRLKAKDVLLDDQRGWWIYHIIALAALYAESDDITLQDITAVAESQDEPVGVFAIAAAIGEGGWRRAGALIKEFESQTQNQGDWFGLLAALRWQVQRGNGRLSARERARAMRLLGEVEIISKNEPLDLAWLFDRFVLAMMVSEEEIPHIMSPHWLWVSHIYRS